MILLDNLAKHCGTDGGWDEQWDVTVKCSSNPNPAKFKDLVSWIKACQTPS
jgi:hypothetical protein